MYQESYSDYIRSILGYPNYGSNSENYCMSNAYEAMPMEMTTNNMQKSELESCYPEIYKVVYPMINKACNTNTRPITPELIEELTNEIYLSIENDNEINVTINLTNEVGTTNNNRNMNSASSNKINYTNKGVMPNATEKSQENRGENRQFRNRGLQDLIRILLIREFLGRPGAGHRPPRPPMRPPFPPPHEGGPRPPFPPQGGPRPPIMPRDLYEEG